MKKSWISLLTASLCIILVASTTLFAQIQTPQASPAATVSQAIGLGQATITYSRPSLKGRTMFGKQLPYDVVWRTGANAVTTIDITEDMSFNGNLVLAGSYSLLSIPGVKEWTIILNQDAKQWGAYTYNPDKDILRFNVKPEKTTSLIENFTIEFSKYTPTSATVAISWENTEVSFEIKQDPDKKIMAQITATLSKSEITADEYLAASTYYMETGRSKDKAYEWSKKAAEMNPKYWTYYNYGRAAAAFNKCGEAIKAAEKGLALANESGDMSFVINNQGIIDSCKKK